MNTTDVLGAGLSPQLKILALLTLLSLLPAIVLTMTSFTRIVSVLSFVRQGIGTQQTPPTSRCPRPRRRCRCASRSPRSW